MTQDAQASPSRPRTDSATFAVPRNLLASGCCKALRQQILSGQLQAGQRLVEAELAEALGVSRSPVREALRALSRDGLVQIHPHRGAFVVAFTPEYMRDLLDVRESLERLAVRRACERSSKEEFVAVAAKLRELIRAVDQGRLDAVLQADFDFHRWLAHLSGNSLLEAIMTPLWDVVGTLRSKSYSNVRRIDVALKEQLAVVEAMGSGRPDLAEERLRAHLERAVARVFSVPEG